MGWRPYTKRWLKDHEYCVCTVGPQDDVVVLFCMDYFGDFQHYARWSWGVRLENQTPIFIVSFESETDMAFFLTGVPR